jgi:LytS/YehU family sensor histidine kinase
LDALDADWTPWTAEPFREFTNLPWRSFTFRVQARDAAGRESREDSVAFAIAAPWWATRGAVAGYALLASCGIFGLVSVRTRTLRRRAAHLETVVVARTAELATKNVELTRLHQLELDEKTAARLAEEKTRLEMLRYQLNPHFLANSLAALRTLVGPQATGARNMIEQLAAFCRMALTRRDETATVRDEIEMLRAYLDTEKSRWRDLLEVTIDADPAVLDVPLPAFLLLPLVENAIKYGGQTTPEKLSLRLTFAADAGGTLVITIANTGCWIPPEKTGNTAESGHIGLDNLRQRLRRHFPDAHEFSTAEANGWVVARLILKANQTVNR